MKSVIRKADGDTEIAYGNRRTAHDLDALAHHLNEICRSATLDLVLKVGALVVTHLYDGSIELWHRVGTSRPSYRALAARSDLALSASALCRAVSIYALVERLGGRERWQRLGTSHFQEVLPLPAAEQERLLLAAEAQGWTVARLRAAARAERDRGIPSSQRDTLRSLRKMAVQLAEYRKSFATTGSLGMEPGAVDDLLGEIHCLREELDALESAANASDACWRVRSRSEISELAPRDTASTPGDEQLAAQEGLALGMVLPR